MDNMDKYRLIEAEQIARGWLEKNVQNVEWDVGFFNQVAIEITFTLWLGGISYHSRTQLSPQLLLDSEIADGIMRRVVGDLSANLGRALCIVGEAEPAQLTTRN